MGDLSEHFDRIEFACRGKDCCGGAAPVSERLIAALEYLRYLANDGSQLAEVTFEIRSGFRCPRHNREEGSRPESLHALAMAADVHPVGMTAGRLAELAEGLLAFNRGGIGIYCDFVHLDVRTCGPARW